jgi:hypothetical protein
MIVKKIEEILNHFEKKTILSCVFTNGRGELLYRFVSFKV